MFAGGYSYYPYWYSPFFSPYWYPSPFFGYPAYAYYPSDHRSALRLQVKPQQTEVFVDGYIAGTVDDFDGTFQSLPLPPGEHEIVLFLEGYRTVRQKIYLTPGSTFRIRHTMEALLPGETAEPRPVPPPSPGPATSSQRPQEITPPAGGSPDQGSRFGTLSIRVRPADAEILIDGERWQGSSGQERLAVEVVGGSHRVEIRRDGYESFSTSIQVEPGHTAPLNVSLSQVR